MSSVIPGVMEHWLSQKRGFEIQDFPETMAIVLAKAEIERLSNCVAQYWRAMAIPVILDQPDARWQQLSCLITQYQGQGWSFFYTAIDQEHLVSWISEVLKTRCLYFRYEDCSSWQGYALFERGILLEEYDFGPDYTEEIVETEITLLAGFGREEYVQSQQLQWDVYATDGELEYKFRSQITEATAVEIMQPYKFLNHRFRLWETWLPDLSWFPQLETATDTIRIAPGSSKIQAMETSQLVRVYGIIQEL